MTQKLEIMTRSKFDLLRSALLLSVESLALFRFPAALINFRHVSTIVSLIITYYTSVLKAKHLAHLSSPIRQKIVQFQSPAGFSVHH